MKLTAFERRILRAVYDRSISTKHQYPRKWVSFALVANHVAIGERSVNSRLWSAMVRLVNRDLLLRKSEEPNIDALALTEYGKGVMERMRSYAPRRKR